MTQIEIPGPDPDWQPAAVPPCYAGRNPASQTSFVNLAARGYRPVAWLRLPMEPIARRLVLTLERSWDDLGEVEGAAFRLEGVGFLLSRLMFADQPVEVAVERSYEDAPGAVDLLLAALATDRRALTHLLDPTTGHLEPLGPSAPSD